MRFDEQFPSLKGKVTWDDFDGGSFGYYSAETLSDNCLDRMRVREAIDSVQGGGAMNGREITTSRSAP
jgi:hypothetical protein